MSDLERDPFAPDDVLAPGPDELVVPDPPPPGRSEAAEIIDLKPAFYALQETFGLDVPEEVWAYYCCTRDVVLPEDKVPGMSYHLAGRPLSAPAAELAEFETYKATAGNNVVRLCPQSKPGWVRGFPVVYITPGIANTDLQTKQHLSDPLGIWLRNELVTAGFQLDQVYATSALRFCLPEGMKTYREAHKRNGAALVRADVYGIQPRLVIASGADALKALFGKSAKMENFVGMFWDWYGIKVFVIPSHQQFGHGHASLGVFRTYLDRAREMLAAGTTSLGVVDTSGYEVCETVDGIKGVCDAITAAADRGEVTEIVIDTEFGNDCAREEFTYTRSIQVCWDKGKAAYFGLFRAEGVPVFTETELVDVLETMRPVFEHPNLKLCGHHLRVDIQRLSELGYDVDDKLATGYDTMLMHHLLHGDDDQGLEVLVHKYAPEFENYWKPLEDWLDANGRTHHLRFGYRDIPDEILVPYSIKDVDATWRCLQAIKAEMAKPGNTHLLDIYDSITAPTSLHLLDIERQGILVDEVRRAEIRAAYQPVHDDLLARLREMLNWKDFNPGSGDQIRMLLFGDSVFKDKKPECVPEGAKLLKGMKPIQNTDKYPREWESIEKAGVARLHTPSTKSEALDLLYIKHPLEELKLLQQVSTLGKFLRDYLYPMELNEFGVPEDGKGIHNNIWDDGKVRTHLHQTSETHRYRSSKPNLQTSPKRQEAEAFAVFVDYFHGCSVSTYYKRCEDGDKKPTDGTWIPPDKRVKIASYKSCLIAPEGYHLVEADFQTAELALLAYASGDPVLIAIVDQGRDLHAESACVAFKLPLLADMNAAVVELNGARVTKGCAYDKWSEAFKKSYKNFRDASKTVNFGKPLQRRRLLHNMQHAAEVKSRKISGKPSNGQSDLKASTNELTRGND